jgi:hypothetical protein
MSHLSVLYLKTDQINLSDFMTDNELKLINEAWLKTGKSMNLASVSEYLVQPLSFSKIRMGLAHIIKSLKTTD